MQPVAIIGGGPAGTAAALAALSEGRPVRLFEKTAFPRHKVCGEFLSPEVETVFQRLGVLDVFEAAKPAPIRRAVLHLGGREKRWLLDPPGRGLSRHALDWALLRAAAARGAEVVRESRTPEPESGPVVLACGRRHSAPRGDRLFGFKAHFDGLSDDSVELFFFPGCYVGVSPVEDGKTNVCGLAPEITLAARGFSIDEVLDSQPALQERLKPLRRRMEWLLTAPVLPDRRFAPPAGETCYRAGDALAFVDPFTGSGMLSALLTGRAAGQAAARGLGITEYLDGCARVLSRQYRLAAFLRGVLGSGLTPYALEWIPGRLLFHATRPRLPAG
ncbi:MAG: tryptophan 7-halogenase [Bryobacterales bacterium]|nr:tryptophan 7-halogenase [Bryobacterales bacterium]